MRAWTQGDGDALVRFVAPARDAGNATLKLGRDTWVVEATGRLPGFGAIPQPSAKVGHPCRFGTNRTSA
jgi:hypothetical protein